MRYEPYEDGAGGFWWHSAEHVSPGPWALPPALYAALPNGGPPAGGYDSRLQAFDALEGAANQLAELADAARRSVNRGNPSHD